MTERSVEEIHKRAMENRDKAINILVNGSPQMRKRRRQVEEQRHQWRKRLKPYLDRLVRR